MVSDLSFSTAILQNSIVNSSSTTTGDNTKPYSFLEFIVNTGVDYSPEEYNKFYIFYLKEWATVRNENTSDKVFINLYIEFLKEITLTYATQQELRFLSTLDFNNPLDLDIAIPFYTEKIRQIILFFKEKRDTGKYVVDRNKIRGTQMSVERALYEKIYDYIVTGGEGTSLFNTTTFALSNITNNLKIDIGEYVDVYSNYFDLPRVESGESGLRKDFYTANTNSIDTSLYFDNVSSIFSSSVFLSSIPLAINVAATTETVCGDDPLTLANEDCVAICGFTLDDRIQLRKRLLSKYIGADIYYIDNTGVAPVSGILIKAEAPYNNIQNLQTVDTATVQSNVQRLLRDIGVFFKPDRTGLFKLQACNFKYEVDYTKLDESKVYIFPDPSVYGNVSYNSQETYPISYVYDYRHEVRNASSSFSKGDPYVRNNEQTFSPYYSKEQLTLNKFADDAGIMLNFNDLFNKGYITKYQTDIFGNEYALFKDELGDTFNTATNTADDVVLNLLLNGHEFYDPIEGYNFDYSTVSIDGYTFRSGLTSHTVEDENNPSFAQTTNPLTLYFREFDPYIELTIPNDFSNTTNSTTVVEHILDGGSFTKSNNDALPDPVFADSADYYLSDGIHYYSELLEAGVSSLSPLERAYFPPLSSESNADFTLDVKYVLSALSVRNYDGGGFNTITGSVNENTYEYDKVYEYIDAVSPNAKTTLSLLDGSNTQLSQTQKRELAGKLYVKNQAFSTSTPATNMLASIYNKYSSDVQYDLENYTIDFDIVYDHIFIETTSYLIYDRIKYDETGFTKPSTKNTYFAKSITGIKAVSNRFFNEKSNTVVFTTFKTLSAEANNNSVTYPEIYQLNLGSGVMKKVYPNATDNVSDTFSLSSVFTDEYNFSIINVQKPVITHNSFNDMYKLSYVCVDNNGLFHLFDHEFNIVNDRVEFYNSNYFKHNKNILTTNFNVSSNTFVDINQVNGYIPYTISAEGELVL